MSVEHIHPATLYIHLLLATLVRGGPVGILAAEIPKGAIAKDGWGTQLIGKRRLCLVWNQVFFYNTGIVPKMSKSKRGGNFWTSAPCRKWFDGWNEHETFCNVWEDKNLVCCKVWDGLICFPIQKLGQNAMVKLGLSTTDYVLIRRLNCTWLVD